MKNIQKVFFVLAILMSCTAFAASAQIYVHVRPSRPVYVRTVAPSPRHVWVEEDWHQRDGRYEWNGGRWEEPPHEGYIYRPGRWGHSGRGHAWKEGRWENGNRGNHGRHEGHDKH